MGFSLSFVEKMRMTAPAPVSPSPAPWWVDLASKALLNVPVAVALLVLIILLAQRDDRMIDRLGVHLKTQLALMEEQLRVMQHQTTVTQEQQGQMTQHLTALTTLFERQVQALQQLVEP